MFVELIYDKRNFEAFPGRKRRLQLNYRSEFTVSFPMLMYM
ncbi:Uncharacterised protein [Raoultella ornithinolytica]|nr:Uncharacterised protein [Raoultella ornithinolytica]